MNMRMGDHMSTDLNTGELHLNSGWREDNNRNNRVDDDDD